MDLQQMYSISASHLLKQNTPSLGEWGGCRYRVMRKQHDKSEKLFMCSVGALIPVDRYLPEMEVMGLRWVLERAFPDDHLKPGFYALALALQRVHDCHNQLLWKEQLEGVAASFGLKGA